MVVTPLAMVTDVTAAQLSNAPFPITQLGMFKEVSALHP